MAIFILKRGLLNEKNFSIGGKRRKDKRKAYELKQQRLAQQNQQAKSTPDKLPANNGSTAIVPVNNTVINQGQSKDNQKKNSSVNPNNLPVKADNSGAANMPVTNNNKQQNSQGNKEKVDQKNLPVIVNNKPEEVKGEQANNINVPVVIPTGEQKKENINPGGNNEKDWKVGPFPTGQQGTTGKVDWLDLGKAAWKKAKPVRVGAAVLGGAALGATLLAANKVGKTVDNAMDDVDDRLEQHRQLRRLKQERRIYERQLR